MRPKYPFVVFDGENEGGVAAPAAVADPPAPVVEPPERTVPLSEVQKERKARQDLEKRLARFEQDAEQRRQAELTESDRLKEQLAQAEAKATAAENKAVLSERRAWIRDAAGKLDFYDAGDAVAQIASDGGLESIETAEDARQAVRDLKGEKPHLVRSSTPDPNLAEVLRDGERPKEKVNTESDGKLLTKAELDALTPDRINELDDKFPRLIERSYAALADA